MPLFEYKCHDCGEVTEELVFGVPNTIMPCPKCKETAVRIFSSPSIQCFDFDVNVHTPRQADLESKRCGISL